MRLAFVSPLPPQPSGVADYAADLLALVAKHHEIELFHAQGEVDAARLPDGLPLHRADRFLERHRRQALRPRRLPDGQRPEPRLPLRPRLARARAAGAPRPGAAPCPRRPVPRGGGGARMAREPRERRGAGTGGSPCSRPGARSSSTRTRRRGRGSSRRSSAPWATSCPTRYPLFRIPVEASRLVAVHNRFMAEAIREEVPERSGRVRTDAGRPRGRGRTRRGRAARAARLRREPPRGRRLRPADPGEAVARRGARRWRARRSRTPGCACCSWDRSRTGRASSPSSTGSACAGARSSRVACRSPSCAAHIEAADVVVHLRYPTARETSAALLRVLAQGRPTIVSDLEQQADLPAGRGPARGPGRRRGGAPRRAAEAVRRRGVAPRARARGFRLREP